MKTPSLIDPALTYKSLTDKISSIVLTRGTRRGWLVGFLIACSLLSLMLVAVTVLFVKGVGIWGVSIPVAWAFAITNFVWWVGIGHAGTLISAILLLMHQKWRNSINRFAEAMTLFAVACAGLFPLLHLGRPWVFYWLFPYPDTMKLWPQFRSPLVWDVFAVSTYAIVSFLFWFTGLVPDLAAMRDQAQNRWARLFYGILAMGWRGSARHWQRHEDASLLLAGLATPLVVSVHSVVSLDFTSAILPGWHSTIFPPYFVAGAIYSGFAMVITLMVPLRAYYGLEQLITPRHLDNMAKILLATGLLVAYSYVIEAFMSWYSGNPFEIAMLLDRAKGTYAVQYWALIFFNLIVVQLLWFKSLRVNTVALFFISIGVNIGMWLERYVIIVSSLSDSFLPTTSGVFHPTVWDWATLAGSFGLFLFLLFLFIRLLPMISIFETRQLLDEARKEP
jgi:molybdopterin-containing oxidoreductase family membrane subunit